MTSSLNQTSLNGALAAVAARLRDSTVQVWARNSHGSGLIASAGGKIVTNAHVASGRNIGVVLADGRRFDAEVTARESGRDLAALQIDAVGLPPAEFRDAKSLRPGEIVIAVGNPLDLVGAATTGIVHVADPRGRRVIADLQLLPGNSGGPLADTEGRVVGVNSMVIDGLAFAISGEVVRRFLSGNASKPYIGVVTQPVLIDVMGARRLGLMVMEVASHAPAARGGLGLGDTIIGVDGRLFESPNDLTDELESAAIGDRRRFDIVRSGRVSGIELVLGDASRKHDSAA